MVAKKARVVIVGAGMAGLVAANKLYNDPCSAELFDLSVVEGGDRIGGRIHTSEFCGDRIELGATWIHGIGGSPVHQIAQEAGALDSPDPWERMDGFPDEPVTIAEGGLGIDPDVVGPVSALYRSMMDFAKGGESAQSLPHLFHRIAVQASASGHRSVGEFLRRGLEAYWASHEKASSLDNSDEKLAEWNRESIEETIFVMHENTERTYTSAGDLHQLDLAAEGEYEMLPGEEITIAKGYSRVVEELASDLPPGLIQLGKKVVKIEWQLPEEDDGPVKLHFEDGSAMLADHVIVTVSLGVLKAATQGHSDILFNPYLPQFKTDAIERLGFGVVNKLFLELEEEAEAERPEFPYLQMAFKQNTDAVKQGKVPWWMRKTDSICPIYKNSRVLLSWFAGEEALQLETLTEEEVKRGVVATLASFSSSSSSSSGSHCNGNNSGTVRLGKVLKTQWGRDPLFMGSYSFVAVGSSGDDLDLLAEPLPRDGVSGVPPLQILFAGEATDRTHYSTTHGAYFSGLRETNRLLKHYKGY